VDLERSEMGRMVWIDMAEERNKWRALVIVVMNLRFP
jgi:hypothetical protein